MWSQLFSRGGDAEAAWRRVQYNTIGMQMLLQVVFPLHEACRTNDAETVKRLLDTANGPQGPDLNAANFRGETPLYLGCTSGSIEIVSLVRPLSALLGIIRVCLSVHAVLCSL